jgi:hypothetical protein
MTLWWAWVGRDPRPGSIVPAWRPPDGVPPGAAGALIDQRAGPADILATLLDLASRGYLTIREVHPSGVPAEGDEAARVARSILQSVGLWTTEWEFRRTDRPLDDLAPFEGAIAHALLGAERSVTMSAVAPSFRELLPGLYQGLYRELVERGWFHDSPHATRREWVILGGVIAAIGAAAIVWLGRIDLGLGLILSGGIVIAFAPAMPVVTREGARARDRLLGLREYIRRAERAEVEAQHEGERAPGHFEEILPYAIALGVVDLWLKEFAGLTEGPGWYLVAGGAEPTTFSVSMDLFWNAAIDAFGTGAGARAG